MVNLRYHVVSLVAVFLALAIGVVLGAGPLQGQISAATAGTNLSEQAENLKQDLATAQASTEQQETFISAAAAEILPESLGGRTVVLVSLPGVEAEESQQVVQMVADAGGKVVGNVLLNDSWVSLTQREYRDTLSLPVSSHLTNPQVGGTADDILSTALTEVLTSSGLEQDTIREIFTDEQTPLVAAESLPTELAESIILVGPTNIVQGTDLAQSGLSSDELTAPMLVALAQAFKAAPQGAVALGAAAAQDDLIRVLRTTNAQIPTVDQVGTSMGSLNAVLALIAGGTGAYGQQEGAKEPIAPFPGE